MKKILSLLIGIIVAGGITWTLFKQPESPRLFPRLNDKTVVDLKNSEIVKAEKEAMFYQKLDQNRVACQLCFRKCIIPEGERGFCRNRENRQGKLYNLIYSRPSAVHIDPIEKEPQLHMLPGTKILCLGTASCNFRCKFCHNWHLSQRSIDEMSFLLLPPSEVIKLAREKTIPTISFTYNEPTVFYEYMYDIAKLAKKKRIRILFHSNGGLNPDPLQEMLKFTDAVTIDLKGFTEEFYQKASSARLEPVLNTLKLIKEKGVHLAPLLNM